MSTATKSSTRVHLDYRCQAFSCEHRPRDQMILVEADGTILAYDTVGEAYTRHHSISADDQARIRKIVAAINGSGLIRYPSTDLDD